MMQPIGIDKEATAVAIALSSSANQ